MSKKTMKQKLGMGIALTGLAAGAGVVAAAVLKKKKRERIYHEAELKAMDELDELMAEQDEVCTGCEEGCMMNMQEEDNDVVEDETIEEPVNDDEPEEETDEII